MYEPKRSVLLLTLLLLVSPALWACERSKGPMEKAGEKVDEAVDEVLHPNEGALEKAGRKTDELLESAKEKVE
jgi:hypothetical protein